jgi:hypothetical protein
MRWGSVLLSAAVTAGALAYVATMPSPSSALASRPHSLHPQATRPLVRIDQPASTILGKEERLMIWQDRETQARWVLAGRPPIYYSPQNAVYYFCNLGYQGPYCEPAHPQEPDRTAVFMTTGAPLVRLRFSAEAIAHLTAYPWFDEPLRSTTTFVAR